MWGISFRSMSFRFDLEFRLKLCDYLRFRLDSCCFHFLADMVCSSKIAAGFFRRVLWSAMDKLSK